jgi:hypothetical protein
MKSLSATDIVPMIDGGMGGVDGAHKAVLDD